MLNHAAGNVHLFHKGSVLAAQVFIIAHFQSRLAYDAALGYVFKQPVLNLVGTDLAHIA